MLRHSVRLVRRRPWAVCGAAVCALAALSACARVLAPPAVATLNEFPHVKPAHLAHLLADVSAHTLTIPGSWTLEEEAGNYTSWRYLVSYACGPRCAGRTAVQAHELASQPRHGLGAAAHLVRVTHTHCTRLLLLPWPEICDEMETESVVSAMSNDGAAEGARLQQWTRGRCSAAAALLARCVSASDLRLAADVLLHRLNDQLHNRNHRLAH